MAAKPRIYAIYEALPERNKDHDVHRSGWVSRADLVEMASAGNIKALCISTRHHGLVDVPKHTFLAPFKDEYRLKRYAQYEEEKKVEVKAYITVYRDEYAKQPRFGIYFHYFGVQRDGENFILDW